VTPDDKNTKGSPAESGQKPSPKTAIGVPALPAAPGSDPALAGKNHSARGPSIPRPTGSNKTLPTAPGSAPKGGLSRLVGPPVPPRTSSAPPKPPPLGIEEISSSILLPEEGLPEPTTTSAEELSGSLLIEDPPDGRGPPIVKRPPGAAAHPRQAPGRHLSAPPPLPGNRPSATPSKPPHQPSSMPPPLPRPSGPPPPRPGPHSAPPAPLPFEPTYAAAPLPDVPPVNGSTAPEVPPAIVAAPIVVPPAAAAPSPATSPGVGAPTTPLPDDVELTQLPRTGIQPFLEKVRHLLQALQAWLKKVASGSATKLGPTTRQLGTSLAASASKLGASTKKLGANTSKLARDVKASLPPASAVRAETAKLAQQLRTNLPKTVSLLRNAETRPKWFVPAVGIAGLAVGVGLVALLVGAMHKGDEPKTAASGEPTSLRLSPSASAAPSESAAAAPASTAPCTVTGSPHVVAPSAVVAAGVEAVRVGDDLAIGFAPTENEGMAVRLDPGSLSATTTARSRSSDPVRRVTPIAGPKGALALTVDDDKASDRVHGRRTVLTDPPLQLGLADGNLVWAPLQQAPGGTLWPLDGSADVESLRGAVESSSSAVAVAFRRGNSIWMGIAEGTTALAAKGALAHVEGLGPAVGSPAVAIGGGVAVVAWADRASADEPWRLRWVHFKPGSPPGPATTFVPPAGGKGEQAMSPGITALSGGRFLLVWTEGPPSGHDVRAQTLSADGRPLGSPLVVSSEGTNAGQGQASVNANGQGVIAFLESRGDSFEVAATSIACGR
jgi:hypothetical protein